MKYLTLLLLLCNTNFSYAQCNCKTMNGNDVSTIICTPKVVVEDSKQFKVFLIGMAKSNNSVYTVSVTQIYKEEALTITGSISFVLQSGTIIQGKLLNSWLDNDEEMGINCISNIIIQPSSVSKFKSSPVKYLSYMSSSGVKYQVTLQSNRDVIQKQALCL